VHLGIAIHRASALDATWTTTHVARAALERGDTVSFFEADDLEVDERAAVRARAWVFAPPADAVDIDALLEDLHDRRAARRTLRLDRLDVLLLRANPLDATLVAFALRLQSLGVRVVNDPAGLMQVSNKAWLASLPGVATPPTLVTGSPGSAHLFFDDLGGDAVVKPASGSGGHAVTWVRRGDHAGLDHALLVASMRSRLVVVQGYLEAATRGETRLVWMDGDLLGGYLRERAPGEFRHNLKQGGTALPCEVTPQHHALVAPLSPHLLALGVRLAGIDVIGDHLVEVNAVNPGGAFHADRLTSRAAAARDIAGEIVARLAEPIRPAHPPLPSTESPRRNPWEPPVR
jgi:glutathione synthase